MASLPQTRRQGLRWIMRRRGSGGSHGVYGRAGRSARRPVHLALTQNVHVNVVNRLASIFIAVHHYAKTVFAAQLFGQALCGKQNVPGQRFVFFGQVIEGGDVFFGMTKK